MVRGRRSCANAAAKFSDEYFDENPDKFSKVVNFVLDKQKQDPNWRQMDGIFKFPLNKRDLTRDQLGAFVPVNGEARMRKLIQKLFGVRDPEVEETKAFGKWLASQGGFAGLIEEASDRPIWIKNEGLAYIAFLRQFCLRNYRSAETLHIVTSDIVVEAVTVLYKYDYSYDKEDIRVLRIRQLVTKQNFKKFLPNIKVLEAQGWWDNKVSRDQYKSLMTEVDCRLRNYFCKIKKDWNEKSGNNDLATEALKFNLNRKKEMRKNTVINKILRSNLIHKNDGTVSSLNVQTAESNENKNLKVAQVNREAEKTADSTRKMNKNSQDDKDDEYEDDSQDEDYIDDNIDSHNESGEKDNDVNLLCNSKNLVKTVAQVKENKEKRVLKSNNNKNEVSTYHKKKVTNKPRVTSIVAVKAIKKSKSFVITTRSASKLMATNKKLESQQSSGNKILRISLKNKNEKTASSINDQTIENKEPSQVNKPVGSCQKITTGSQDAETNSTFSVDNDKTHSTEKEAKDKTVESVNHQNHGNVQDKGISATSTKNNVDKKNSLEAPCQKISSPAQDALKNAGSNQVASSQPILNHKRKIIRDAALIYDAPPEKQPRHTQEDDQAKVSSSVEPGGHMKEEISFSDGDGSPPVVDLTLDENENDSTISSGSNVIFDVFKKQWEEQKYCDVTVTTQCGNKIKAHKNILSAKNAEFSRIFDSLEPGQTTVEITGVPYKILKEIVRYLYCDQVDIKVLDVPTVGRLLAASVTFKIDGLENFCKDYLISHLDSVENANYILDIGKSFGFEDFKTAAWEFLKMTRQIQSKYANN